MEEIAAALAQLVQGKTPLLLKAPPERPRWEGREERGREGRTASPRHAHASGQPGGATAPGRGLGSRLRGNDARVRHSVVSGQSVSVRVDLGGRRFIKKKQLRRTHHHT